MPPPDTEEVRTALIDLVRTATPDSTRGYPAGLSLVEAAILQLGELREARALPELDRLLDFPQAPETEEALARDPGRLAELASRAAARIVSPEELAPFRTARVSAIAADILATGDFATAPVLADALEEAGCDNRMVLDYLRGPATRGTGRSWVIGLLAAAPKTPAEEKKS
jgi:hypothetical protein